jgi:metal-dependent amidase/aminoacylase/carboxypeptidase family protein
VVTRLKQNKWGNLSNVRAEVSGYFRNKKREYLKDTIDKLATINKNIRHMYKGISKFKRGHQPRNNIVKDGNDDLLADFYKILNTLKKYFFIY